MLESRESIFSRIELVLEILRDSESATILLINHSFFIKILEAFKRTQGKIVNHLDLIKDFIVPAQKTYEFEKRFDFNI